MTKYVEKSRKKLPKSIKLKNSLTAKQRRFSHDPFRRLDNMLWNIFGPPMYAIKYDFTKKHRHYFKHNADAKWFRSRNEVLVKDQATLDIILKFMPHDYTRINKII